jgi:hypothetical protein
VSAPLVNVIQQDVPAAATAVSDDSVIAQSPFAGTVTAVQYVPEAAITGAATNNRTVSLVNKGAAGSGSTVVATLTFASGTNATANNEVALTLSSTAADLVVAEGDTLQWRSIANGTGLADPGGVAKVSVSRS